MKKTPARQPTLAAKREKAQNKDRPKYGENRRRILKAAGPVLLRYGLQGTTVESIAKEAGVDRATIYYYFPDKHEIFRESIREGLQELVDGLEAVAVSGEPPAVRLRQSMRVAMCAFERHYPQLYIFFQDSGTSGIIDEHLSEEIVKSGRRYEDLVEATVRDGIASGEFGSSLPPKVTAKLVVGMLNWTYRWFHSGGPLSAEVIADGMADTVLQGLVIAPPRPRSRRASGR